MFKSGLDPKSKVIFKISDVKIPVCIVYFILVNFAHFKREIWFSGILMNLDVLSNRMFEDRGLKIPILRLHLSFCLVNLAFFKAWNLLREERVSNRDRSKMWYCSKSVTPLPHTHTKLYFESWFDTMSLVYFFKYWIRWLNQNWIKNPARHTKSATLKPSRAQFINKSPFEIQNLKAQFSLHFGGDDIYLSKKNRVLLLEYLSQIRVSLSMYSKKDWKEVKNVQKMKAAIFPLRIQI